MYSKLVSMGIFCVIVGCSVTLLSIPTNGTSQPSEKFPFKSKPLPEYISKFFVVECETDDGSCFKFERKKGGENKCEHERKSDYEKGVFRCTEEFSKENPTFLKITGFDDIRLPLESQEQLKNKRFVLYTSSITSKGLSLGFSFPIYAFTIGGLCIDFSPLEKEVCTEKDITLKDIIMSKEEPVKMNFTAVENESCSSFSSETTSVRGDYKLIVISLSSGFEKPHKLATTIQSSIQKLLVDLKKAKQNTQLSVWVISSGREVAPVLTSEQLKQLDKKSIRTLVENKISFTAQDLRPMDDLELVDEFIIKDYEDQYKPVGGILYITNDDRFGDEIPRNQCMPLAWHRDNIQLKVLTSQSCDIWKKHARLVQPGQCDNIQNKGVEGLVKVFKQFLAN